MTNMIKGKVAYFILGIILVTAIILRLAQFFSREKVPNEIVVSKVTEVMPKEVEQKFILEGDLGKTNKLAILETPLPNSVVSSPLVVKGEAPGAWFFESSFPVKLTDDKDNVIVIKPAIAQSDALTENFVPYEVLLEFETKATSGYLILTNDNPSGLLENELSLKIPVTFLNK